MKYYIEKAEKMYRNDGGLDGRLVGGWLSIFSWVNIRIYLYTHNAEL